MSRNIWFDYLTTAHVQTGTYTVTETYLPGKHQLPRTPQITAAGNTPLPYPESFNREWATFVTPTDATDKGYDPGAYGIGVNVHTREILIPTVKEVHLLYYYDMESTREERNLVQVDVVDGDPVVDLGIEDGIGVVSDVLDSNGLPTRRVFTEDQFYSAFAGEGFNRYGFVLPPGFSRSKVSELHSFTGTFTDVDDDVDTYTVYMSPLYIANERPLFDFIYLQKNATNLRGEISGISGHLLRWRGGVPSSTIAPINRAGDAIQRDGYLYNVAGQVITDPTESGLSIDGVSYDTADAYNVRNYKRQ